MDSYYNQIKNNTRHQTYLYIIVLYNDPRVCDTIKTMKTKGATSHIDVSLSDLTANLAPTATVRVSRRWAEALGLTGVRPAQPEAPKTVAIQVEEKEPKIDLEVDSW